ncbi:MAG TPA: hypothetical protein VFM93_05065 [Candidatus Limnocylindria bacterium]|nr:hypothetical protein [Candidatus Limnocylindria bacterium]
MLRALTLRRSVRTRLALGAAAVVLGLAAGAASLAPEPARTAPPSLPDRLPAGSWGIAVPSQWIAAPIADMRPGDRLDLLAIRAGERSASAIAFDLEVMSADEAGLVLAASAFDATAIATARAAGQLLVPLVRSSR